MSGSEFHWLDYVLFIGTIVAALAIGTYNACSSTATKTAEDFLTGSNQLGVIPIALSVMMSGFSSISVLGITAEMYFHGTQMFWTSTAGLIGTYISVHLFVPIYYHCKILSSFQYHDGRFHSIVLRRLTSLISIALWLFYAGACAYAPSIALAGVTEIPLWAGIVCTAVVGTIYTSIGGIRAVIWTDAFQALILFIGVIAVVVVGTIEVGGLSKVFEIADEGGRIRFFDMDPDPTLRTSFWSVTIPYIIVYSTIVPSVQTTVQRIQASGSEKKAKIALYIQAPLWIVMDGLFLLTGLTIYAYYEYIGCDPMRSMQIESANQLLPFFIVDVLNFPGLPGAFIAVLFSGSLSSISSSLNAVAALVWMDFFVGLFPNASQFTKKLINVMITILAGILSILISWLVTTFDTHILQVIIAWSSGLGSPIAALIMLGAAFPRAQWRGAFIGLFAGTFLTTWINVGQYLTPYHTSFLPTNTSNCPYPYNISWPNPTDPPKDEIFGLYQLSFLWIGAVGWLTTIVVGLISSYLTCPEDPEQLDPRLMIPWGERILCCVEEEKRKDMCMCGVRHDENPLIHPELNKDHGLEEDPAYTGFDNKAFEKKLDKSSFTLASPPSYDDIEKKEGFDSNGPKITFIDTSQM